MAKYKVKEVRKLARYQRGKRRIGDNKHGMVYYSKAQLSKFLLDSANYHLDLSYKKSWKKGAFFATLSAVCLATFISEMANINSDYFPERILVDLLLFLTGVASGVESTKEIYPKIKHQRKAEEFARLYSLNHNGRQHLKKTDSY